MTNVPTVDRPVIAGSELFSSQRGAERIQRLRDGGFVEVVKAEHRAGLVLDHEDGSLWERAIGIPVSGFQPDNHRFLVADGDAVVMLRRPPFGPHTVAELERHEQVEADQHPDEADARDQQLAELRRTAPVVTARELDRHAPLSLRDAAETVHAAGGRITVEKGVLVVHVHPEALHAPQWAPGAVSTVAVAVRALYGCEAEVLRCAKGKDGDLLPRSFPDRPLLPSGHVRP